MGVLVIVHVHVRVRVRARVRVCAHVCVGVYSGGCSSFVCVCFPARCPHPPAHPLSCVLPSLSISLSLALRLRDSEIASLKANVESLQQEVTDARDKARQVPPSLFACVRVCVCV